MLILPRHEQHYPAKVLQHRLEEYVRASMPPTTDRRDAVHVTGREALDTVIRNQAQLGLTNIDPRYYVATCFHEAGCLNEWDTEVATASCPPGFVSVGPYQIGDEEARRYGHQLDEMMDLDKATSCMIRLAEDNRRSIRTAAGLVGNVPDPDYTDAHGKRWPGGMLRPYLAIAHNKGIGFARLTIQRNRLDWPAYKERNPLDNIVDHGYGEDCVTGGPLWPEDIDPPRDPAPRLLRLTEPRMTGVDVRTLQTDLSVHGVKTTTDGEFGPNTDQAVRTFQRTRGLIMDGIVGTSTRMALLKPP
jgi:hypothetical protein